MRNQDSEFILNRLANLSNSGEGATLPPRLINGQRVPNISKPFIARTTLGTGGTYFDIVFDEPPLKNLTYNVYYKIESAETKNVSQLSGPVSSQSSPVRVFVPSSSDLRVTFYVQCILPSGLSSTITSSPTCGGVTL